MSQLKAEFVKTGYWVNLAKGPVRSSAITRKLPSSNTSLNFQVMGATITTSTTTGNLVIALLAVLTTLGTTHLWNLITFTYYQCHLHYRPADGLYWQQQALLRTLPTPATLVSDWLRLWWSWRKRTDKVLQRTLPPVAISFIFTVAIVAAGIFSSYIVDGKNIEVLVRSRFCGPLNFEAFLPDTDTYDPIAVIKHYSKITALGYSYAKDCYETGNQPERCQIFIQPTVPIRQERVECPFGNRLCKNIDLPGIVLDSDYVNLNSFGLNLEEKDRVGYRKRTTCAVFELRDHSVIINAADLESFEYLYGEKPYKDEQLVLLYFGESSYADFTFSTSLFRQNFSGTLTVE